MVSCQVGHRSLRVNPYVFLLKSNLDQCHGISHPQHPESQAFRQLFHRFEMQCKSTGLHIRSTPIHAATHSAIALDREAEYESLRGCAKGVVHNYLNVFGKDIQ
jgi:hypothetical protein